MVRHWDFNPRAPCGARPGSCGVYNHGNTISIHAPHAGRDTKYLPQIAAALNFNPRAPCGARLLTAAWWSSWSLFQSTRPMRGATSNAFSASKWVRFQSTRPMRGATSAVFSYLGSGLYFNPRAPCGARLFAASASVCSLVFQSTRPMRGATWGPSGVMV